MELNICLGDWFYLIYTKSVCVFRASELPMNTLGYRSAILTYLMPPVLTTCVTHSGALEYTENI